jgi:hypothetical protein
MNTSRSHYRLTLILLLPILSCASVNRAAQHERDYCREAKELHSVMSREVDSNWRTGRRFNVNDTAARLEDCIKRNERSLAFYSLTAQTGCDCDIMTVQPIVDSHCAWWIIFLDHSSVDSCFSCIRAALGCDSTDMK